MTEVATCLLFDRDQNLVIYLRDNKPSIPFPNSWDLFGGTLEDGETPEQALSRELSEELSITDFSPHFFRDYSCVTGDVSPNIKHVFWAIIEQSWDELTLNEGQQLAGINLGDRFNYMFANILSNIIEDFVRAGIVPHDPNLRTRQPER